jgi:hypothetical protein
MEKALPCKICGNAQYLVFKCNGPNIWWVHCDDCGAVGPDKETPTKAGRAWNKEQKKE